MQTRVRGVKYPWGIYRRRDIMKRKYGITLSKYYDMFVQQKGKCTICSTHQDDLGRLLAVDHDHKTGKIRELLCGPCNHGLGNFRDSPALLQRAIKYLERHNRKGVSNELS